MQTAINKFEFPERGDISRPADRLSVSREGLCSMEFFVWFWIAQSPWDTIVQLRNGNTVCGSFVNYLTTLHQTQNLYASYIRRLCAVNYSDAMETVACFQVLWQFQGRTEEKHKSTDYCCCFSEDSNPIMNRVKHVNARRAWPAGRMHLIHRYFRGPFCCSYLSLDMISVFTLGYVRSDECSPQVIFPPSP